MVARIAARHIDEDHAGSARLNIARCSRRWTGVDLTIRTNQHRTRQKRMSIETIAAKIGERIGGSGFDRSVKFDLQGAGVIVIDGSDVSTSDREADCTITMSLDDFESLVAGDLNPTAAFMQGKMKIEGDMSVAMQLSQVL
jgi:putative sterol carrier protein